MVVAFSCTFVLDLIPGSAFVDLVPVRPEFVVEAVAAALGVIEHPQEPLEKLVQRSSMPGSEAPRPGQLRTCPGCRRRLRRFSPGYCPHLVVLSTSRERLGIIGERVVELAPLGLTSVGPDASEAEALFIDRAGLATASLDAQFAFDL